MNNLSEIMVKSVSEKEKLKEMYDWSKGFQKFVCCPLSAGFLQKRTLKEMEENGRTHCSWNRKERVFIFEDVGPYVFVDKIIGQAGCAGAGIRTIIEKEKFLFQGYRKSFAV